MHLELDIALLVLAGMAFVLIWNGKFPKLTSEGIAHTAELLNTKGGIILLLGIMSFVFFFVGVRWLYWSTMLIVEGKLGADNALTLSGFGWITGAAFGGAFGALLNSLKGEPIPPMVEKLTKVETSQTSSGN